MLKISLVIVVTVHDGSIFVRKNGNGIKFDMKYQNGPYIGAISEEIFSTI